MTRRLLLYLILSFLLIGCNNARNECTEINALNNKIEQLESQVLTLENANNRLKNIIERRDSEIDDLIYSVGIGYGFAVQYSFDMQIMYDELRCPNYKVNSDIEQFIISELLGRLKEDSLFEQRKIVTLNLVPIENDSEWDYFVNGIAFEPQDQERLKMYIKNGESVPFPSVKSYSIRISVHDNTLDYEIVE